MGLAAGVSALRRGGSRGRRGNTDVRTQHAPVGRRESLATVLPIPASCSPFCHFTPEQQKSVGHEYAEVRDCMLGWDIPDYGLGGVSFRIHSGE